MVLYSDVGEEGSYITSKLLRSILMGVGIISTSVGWC